ncbi:MAG: hypothetical protein IK140_03305 [Clostridia bacterium]|nr:hypothetical protein [Clostridia bacterium]
MSIDPVLLRMRNGEPLTKAENWPERRKELLDTLAREEYGYFPPALSVNCTVENTNNAHWGGHGIEERLCISGEGPKSAFSFPVTLLRPDGKGPYPLFLFLSFEDSPYQKYFPLQEVLSRGFAVAMIPYKGVTSDDQNMADGVAAALDRPEDGTGWGKITLWAWAASRTLDALKDREELDMNSVAVIGHSRLGKTALWCGANDERIRYVCSNDSGSSGAAYARGKDPRGENVRIITQHFPFWFCENFRRYADREDDMPFDQHWLLAACCPRFVAVTSASQDYWAGPESEEKSCKEASPAWELLGRDGYRDDGTGDIAYQKRDGIHFLALEDWRFFMDFASARRS